jgi:hypothetical protein
MKRLTFFCLVVLFLLLFLSITSASFIHWQDGTVKKPLFLISLGKSGFSFREQMQIIKRQSSQANVAVIVSGPKVSLFV